MLEIEEREKIWKGSAALCKNTRAGTCTSAPLLYCFMHMYTSERKRLWSLLLIRIDGLTRRHASHRQSLECSHYVQ